MEDVPDLATSSFLEKFSEFKKCIDIDFIL